MTSEQKIKRALAQLDDAIQAWYAEHNPKNKECYACATFMNCDDDWHASRVTLNNAKGEFIDIVSKRNGHGEGN